MAKGVLGGLQPDPEKGTPFRLTRQKARLMMDTLSHKQRNEALLILVNKHPQDALDAMIEASGET